ncbi:hypothetical protein [Macrococcus animalis]|uniref:hypothetical protein n=1 Tax=Macrococcus animalis TaxID=3395467 RepID=UPI0039BDC460
MTNTKEIIINFIKENPGTSFVEIERLFEDNGFEYQGNQNVINDKYEQLIYWSNWNEEAIDLIKEIMFDDNFKINPCHKLVYIVDGKVIELRTTHKERNCMYPTWLPMTLSYEVKR